MRAFAARLRAAGHAVDYLAIDDPENRQSLPDNLDALIARHRSERFEYLEPDEWRLDRQLADYAAGLAIPAQAVDSAHFFTRRDEAAAFFGKRQRWTMEPFYRQLRQRHGILMAGPATPQGGRWNFDAENRAAFGNEGPGWLPAPIAFPPDDTTRAVLDLVQRQFPSNPGRLDAFDLPVTREQALAALDDFVAHRLPLFGRWQDAMWRGEPWLYHSRLSAALNLKLISPREACTAVEQAWRDGRAPHEAVEGFVRQVLGWREYVRGIYWREMPGYLERNALAADRALPAFYWSGETDLACLRETIGQTLALGYAHHIQRLMVTGLFALLWGVRPREVHEWYLSVYVDAVEWVEAPNTLGMSQYADGGLLASKPYVATGKYLARMSNYCDGCRYRPEKAHGENACPFTTLYWDFLARHRERFARHPRLALQVRNLDRLSDSERAAIAGRADELRRTLDPG
jgi:deoxyribodipyrimidine photolyase-related protein